MTVLLANNANTKLASPVAAGDTTISVKAGGGELFPSPASGDWFPLALIKPDGQIEIARCTARSGNDLTVLRAQEGTTARSFSAGDRVELRLTKGALDEFMQGWSPDWADYSGSANAITLTCSRRRSSYKAGDKVRFRATAANTGAATANMDGLGAKSIVTVTGVALPAGYIRTDVETVMTYDGTRWVADREVERVTNINGDAVRYADGRQEANAELIGTNASVALGALFRSDNVPWVYPAAFLAGTYPRITINGGTTNLMGTLGSARTNTSVDVRGLATAAYTGNFLLFVTAIGRWY